MKFFVAFSAVVAIACASPTTWTLNKLDEAIDSPLTSASFKPVLLSALDGIMDYLYQGHEQVPMVIKTQAGPIGTFNLNELSDAIERTEVDSIFKPYMEEALNQMMDALFAGQAVKPVTVEIPALLISSWTLKELDEALSSDIDPELRPYLVDALNRLYEALFHGQQVSSILVAAPADLFEAEISPSPVVAEPVAVSPNPVEVPTSSPLVQIILNVQDNVYSASPLER